PGTFTEGDWENSGEYKVLADLGNDVYALDVGDLAGGADKDIVIGADSGGITNNLRAYKHPGTTPFSSSWTSIFTRDTGVDIRDVTIGDFDGDGDNDVAHVFGLAYRISFMENDDGADTFTALGSITLSEYGNDFVIGNLIAFNFAGDGDIDIVVISSTSLSVDDEVRYLKNDGTGDSIVSDFTVTDIMDINYEIRDAVVDDFDGDGDGDIAVVGQRAAALAGEIYVVENGGGESYTRFTESSFSDTNLDIRAIVVMDLGADGNIWKDLVIGLDSGTADSGVDEVQVLQNAIPEFTTLLAPIVSVIGIVAWNYRRRQSVEQ
ncbi:MAG: hypothetical protein QGG57_06395, partial [Candidatus Poseidoniia archaeon]|nr:hypothetical protein [Candidatus Poseidoniia archaeon]